MSYDQYDAPRSSRREREPRYADRDRDRDDGYLRPHGGASQDLIRSRPREESDYSVEEIPREFPPPSYAGRPRSADPGYYDRNQVARARGSSYRYEDDDYYDDRRVSRKKGNSYEEEEERSRKRVVSKQQQILAAVAGAALLAGGKELYDRHEAKKEGRDIHRNLMVTASLAAGGALAGYQGTEFYNKHERKEAMAHGGARGGGSDGEGDEKEKKGPMNFLEGALAAAGLGTAVKALTGGGGKDDDKSDTRSRRGSDTRSKSGKSEGGKNENASRIQKAAMASLIAGATEAFRVSKEPGGWKGEKAKRVLTAAVGAGAIDSTRDPEKNGKMHLAESVIGGLVGNRMLNGSKSNIEEDKKTGRSRSRSRARNDGGGGGSSGVAGLASLAAAGLAGLGAKKAYDATKERSRSRGGRGRGSDDDDDRPRERARSRSVVDTARGALAKLGIGSAPDNDDDDRRRDRSRDDRGGGRRKSARDDSDDDYDDRRPRGGGGGDKYDRDRGRDHSDDSRSYGGGRDRSRSRNRGAGGKDRGDRGSRRSLSRGSSTDLGDSDSDNRKQKKMKGKQILTTGLAAVATIHAAHNVYQSMEKRAKRQRAVKEGRLTEEEAKKLRHKALLQDAASVGIAALGIKGAISEFKEVREMSHEINEFKEEREHRHQRRLERQKRLADGGGRRSQSADDHNRARIGYDSDYDDYDYDEPNHGAVDRYRGGAAAPDYYDAPPRRASEMAPGPLYQDANPYGVFQAPPVGGPRR